MGFKIKNFFQKESLMRKVEQFFLRDIILEFNFEEVVKWRKPTYSLYRKNLISLSGFKTDFTICFFQDSYFKEEAKVLVDGQEGIIKYLRHKEFKSQGETNYINESKLESIRISRLEIIAPSILKGEGLNNKYKYC